MKEKYFAFALYPGNSIDNMGLCDTPEAAIKAAGVTGALGGPIEVIVMRSYSHKKVKVALPLMEDVE